MAEDIRQLLLAAFDVEHREHVTAIRGALGSATPDWNDVFRRAHSLKGASRAVDLPAVEAVAHRLETLFERVRTGATALDRDAANAVHLALDRVEAYVAGLKDGAGPEMPSDALTALGRVLDPPGAAQESAPAAAEPSRPAVDVPAAAPVAATASAPAVQKAAAEPADPGTAFLRVPGEAVDAMARASHDLASTLAARAPAAESLARLARRLATCAPARRRSPPRRPRSSRDCAPSRLRSVPSPGRLRSCLAAKRPPPARSRVPRPASARRPNAWPWCRPRRCLRPSPDRSARPPASRDARWISTCRASICRWSAARCRC
ncbi:Hpt domain-containing protein [Methylobacterium tardum]|uniref:Hpt domain-containing protein n=1 Tax=Methylobacterium tardum TaxID=374432 RepID=UPI0020213BC4|nr:Hpt domain-containing protein [Methylobacterium tardum]URD39047.1 Hpt domain-containing protein [Methylobacterium tardum]